MKKLIALVLALVMALSLTTIAWGAGEVAKIGNTGYATLQAAVNAAVDGDTITLLSDIEYNSSNCGFTDPTGPWYNGVKYTGDKSFTIDLNGKTISDNGDINDYLLNFINKGAKANEITLKNGTIIGGANLWTVLSVGSSSATYPTTLNLGAGLTVTDNGAGSIGEVAVVKCRFGSVVNVLDGATVKTDTADYCVAGGTSSTDTTAVANIYSGATITMNNAAGIAVSGTANVNIYGGTITSAGWGVYTMTSGTPVFTISGGTITGAAGAVASAADVNSYPTADPSVTISGGDINGEVSELVFGTPAGTAGGEVIVTGGIFDTDPTAYAASGYEAAEVGSTGGTFVVGQDIEVDAGKITAGTFTDDVRDYVADGSSAVVSGGKLVVSVGNTGSTNSYDDDDVTIIAKDGSKVAIADGAKVVMTQESKKTVNGKFASLVPAHFTYNGVKYVVCHEASATHVVTVKGVKYYTCAFNGAVPSVEKDGGVLYTAPKKATCGKVGVNEDKYVVIDNVYYLLSDSGTNYALVGGKMVVYSNTTGTMQEHVYDAVKSELKYNTDRTVATFKCAVCNNTIPVVAKKPNFATNYTAITLGNEGTYYYVSNTTGTTVSGGTTTGGTVNSADTFDAGIAMYVGMSVMAAAGSAVVIGKKKD